MKPIVNPGHVHVIRRNGVIVDMGGEQATPQCIGGVVDMVEWFAASDTMTAYGVRETTPEVIEFQENRVRVKRSVDVEKLKTDDEYREKSIEAKQIIADPNSYDPTIHEFIALEVDAQNITPLAAAQAVAQAIRQTRLEQARKRITLREELRAAES